jgi:hypothetical protein
MSSRAEIRESPRLRLFFGEEVSSLLGAEFASPEHAAELAAESQAFSATSFRPQAFVHGKFS